MGVERLSVPGAYSATKISARHDIARLSLILHSFTPDQDKQIPTRTFACLPAGGLVLISELLIQPGRRP